MAHLAVVGSHAVNGVAALHTRAPAQERSFPEFDELYPGKVPEQDERHHAAALAPPVQPPPRRRWSPGRSAATAGCATSTGCAGWRSSPTMRASARVHGGEAREQGGPGRAHPRANAGCTVSPDAIFDVQIKRLHEYKRQHLNLLHILALYRRLLHNPALDIAPRVFIFAAKAAPGLRRGQEHHPRDQRHRRPGSTPTRASAASSRSPSCPNYRVSLAEKIIPAADLSEQISTAGKEASGTGQHEARPQRRAHHRDPRRRQHRDPGGGRRRRTSSSSA